nr:papain fold toxin domain-containing protein [Microcoleus sp. PH2017_30_WIL_O_A]
MIDDELRQQISEIASKFKLFECNTCALSIQEFLIQRGISGKKVKIYTGSAKGKYGNITMMTSDKILLRMEGMKRLQFKLMGRN